LRFASPSLCLLSSCFLSSSPQRSVSPPSPVTRPMAGSKSAHVCSVGWCHATRSPSWPEIMPILRSTHSYLSQSLFSIHQVSLVEYLSLEIGADDGARAPAQFAGRQFFEFRSGCYSLDLWYSNFPFSSTWWKKTRRELAGGQLLAGAMRAFSCLLRPVKKPNLCSAESLLRRAVGWKRGTTKAMTLLINLPSTPRIHISIHPA